MPDPNRTRRAGCVVRTIVLRSRDYEKNILTLMAGKHARGKNKPSEKCKQTHVDGWCVHVAHLLREIKTRQGFLFEQLATLFDQFTFEFLIVRRRSNIKMSK